MNRSWIEKPPMLGRDTIVVDESKPCEAANAWGALRAVPGKRRDALGRAALWHAPHALLADADRMGGVARLLPPWLPLGSVGAALREREKDGAP